MYALMFHADGLCGWVCSVRLSVRPEPPRLPDEGGVVWKSWVGPWSRTPSPSRGGCDISCSLGLVAMGWYCCFGVVALVSAAGL